MNQLVNNIENEENINNKCFENVYENLEKNHVQLLTQCTSKKARRIYYFQKSQ